MRSERESLLELGQPGARLENELLLALAGENGHPVLSRLERVRLGARQALNEANEPMAYVYFPRTCLLAVLAVMADGASVGIATVGSEGMVSLPAFLGETSALFPVMCILPGEAWRLSASELRAATTANAGFHEVLDQYASTFLTEVAQGAACNRLHPTVARLACWLLGILDRLELRHLPVTHDALAEVLGVRRATVTEAVEVLARAGLVAPGRGRLTILDRRGLESAACECYRVIAESRVRLLFRVTASAPAWDSGSGHHCQAG